MKTPIPSSDFLSSGCTLLNLAGTGRLGGFYCKGHYYFFVGDSVSGKTWLALSALAEATGNKHFADYRLIYDNVEDGALMDLGAFFGKGLQKRLEPPSEQGSSNTIEEFYFHLDDAFKQDQPFIYVLDSMDALSSEEELQKFSKYKAAYLKGREESGSYGDGKAKKNSSGIRQALSKLRQTRSILVVINQTRDNLGFGSTFEKKTRSGGRALRFYATIETWSSVREQVKSKVRGKNRELGIISQVSIKKNRITGRKRTVEVPIYHSYGIDDIDANIGYLLEEGHWKQSKGMMVAPELDFRGSRRNLIEHVEKEGLEFDLQELVAKVWREVEEACELKRKPRYG